MPIHRILENQKVVECRGDQNLKDCSLMMKNDDVGSIVVTKDHKPVGVVTDRDIALRCVAEGKDPSKTLLKEVMSSPVITVSRDEGIYHIIDRMRDSQCRRIVIVDDAGKTMGLISAGDLLKLLIQELSMLSTILTPEEDKIKRSEVA